MRIIDLKSGKETCVNSDEYIACCVGNFDGVHKGHKELIEKTVNNNLGLKTAVWTFESNSKGNIKILTPLSEKISFFKSYGLDYAILENFENVKSLNKETFIKDILYDKCNVRYGVCGFNFAFGKGASGNSDDFKNIFSELGVKTEIVMPVMVNSIPVSSSVIRECISKGDFSSANEYLGHKFYYKSIVVTGNRLGRKLGFPTANQYLDANICTPKFGVYKSETETDGKVYQSISYFGTKPTVQNKEEIICETHIFDFSSDLYGQEIKVYPLEFIREELKFDSLEELKNEVMKNIREVKS